MKRKERKNRLTANTFFIVILSPSPRLERRIEGKKGRREDKSEMRRKRNKGSEVTSDDKYTF